MRRLKDLLLKDWQYKMLALLMGTFLWFILSLGTKMPVRIEKPIEVFNQEEGYAYKIGNKRARLRLRVMERFVPEEVLERMQVGVNVRSLREGEYNLRVEVKNLPRFVVQIEKVEPEYIRIRVIKAPEGGN
ncbi:MAG: hypothetical protein ACK4OF_02920 [Aquificaceae bacterium]